VRRARLQAPGLRLAGVIGLGAALLVGLSPAVVTAYELFVVVTLLRYVVLAQAWNLLAGYTGLLSLGNQVFVGVGAYVMSLVLIHWGWPLVAAFLVGGGAAALFGVVTYLPLFRLRGGYFAISTLLVALATSVWMVNWDFVGANSGLNLPPAAIPSLEGQFFYAWLTMLGFLAVQWGLLRTRLGLFFQAVRDDEEAAQTVGTNPLTVKVAAVGVSAFASGLAGGLLAMELISIQPGSAFSINVMLDMLVMVTIGGMGTLMGPAIGAVLLIVMEQELQQYETVSLLLKAVLLIAAVQVAPQGLMGVLSTTRSAATRWRKVRVSETASPRR